MSHLSQGIVPGLRSTRYVYDRAHGLLVRDAWRGDGPNIGDRGGRLTIMFLSMNRSALSIQLLSSIENQLKDFTGEVLIVDNGSDPEELRKLHEARKRFGFCCRIVELGQNFGVAGGRNRGLPHVGTEWLLSLDNDIYFVSNPIRIIQQEIAMLGCHFLNLPLLDRDGQTLFALGGHLYAHARGGDLTVGGGSVYAQQAVTESPAEEPFLSTFLFGGASVLNVETFGRMGGFDEGMFVGFEDIDFSVRLFQAGYKIGNSRALALVHDHPAPQAPQDRDYERQRFSSPLLRKSAEHLERKHGITVWSDSVDQWLATRHRELGIADESVPATAEQAPPASPRVEVVERRPRVALLVDSEGWAFWNISQQVCRHLGSKYDFRVIPVDKIDHVVQTFLMVRDCDIVHVFWREYLRLLLTPHCSDYLRWLGSDFERFRERILSGQVVSACVYDHLYLEPQELSERAAVYRELASIYYVGSRRLYDIYCRAPGYPRPAMVLEDGVDPALFYPMHLDRLESVGERELVVGWTGNSDWGGLAEDYKGVRTLLKPAVEQLRAEGLPIRLQLADRAESPLIPHERMVHYYSGIDLYVCTSLIEGTPNPVLESMACGVPVVSTDVGIVREALGTLQAEFILAERSIECLKAALRRLIAEPDLLSRLSAENLERATSWYWSVKTQGFDRYFQQCLAIKAGLGHKA